LLADIFWVYHSCSTVSAFLHTMSEGKDMQTMHEIWRLTQCLLVQLNTTLVSLELNSNSIDYDGATALAEAISENTSLTSLYLR